MKLFNNVLIYRLTELQPVLYTDRLDELLAEHPSREPTGQQMNTLGFVEPLGVEGIYAEPIDFHAGWEGISSGAARLIRVRIIERVIPARVIRREVKARVEAIEEQEARKVYGREKQAIKAEIVERLLPRAFMIEQDISAIVHGNLIFIDTSSLSKAEALLSMLREAVGSLRVVPLLTMLAPGTAMSNWAINQETGVPGLRLGNSFKVEDVFEKGSTLSGSHMSLSDSDAELLSELSNGRAVTQLGLSLIDEGLECEFTLTDRYVIKGIRWPYEYVQLHADELGERGQEDSMAESHRVAHMLVLHGLDQLSTVLINALGGINEGRPIAEASPSNESDDGADLI